MKQGNGLGIAIALGIVTAVMYAMHNGVEHLPEKGIQIGYQTQHTIFNNIYLHR